MLDAKGKKVTSLINLPIHRYANNHNEGSRVQGFKYLLLVSLLISTQVSIAAAPVFGSAAQTRYARQLTPPKGKALIYIYQRKQGGAVSPRIWLNNYEIGRIVPGSFTVWQLAAGSLELRVGGTEPARVSLISHAGRVYLFRLSVTQSAGGTRAEIESLPGSYRNELADTRFIKNPRQVTAQPLPSPPRKTVKPRLAEKTTPPAPQPRVHARPAPRVETSVRPGGVSLSLKLGSLGLSKTTQSILSTDRQFDKNASGVFAAEVDYQFRDGTSIGGELLDYKTSYTTVGSTTGNGDVTVAALMAVAKQYYRPYTRLQPYLGIGAGLAATKVSGAITGSTTGFSYQLLAGLEYRFPSLGVMAEYKYVDVSTKSSNGQKIDASGSGIFAGVTFHF
ncbi:MAG: outer membrane beta-barrel protein [Gammaproteobacteria bacterium]